jgi:Flp pilus assembly protein TadD
MNRRERRLQEAKAKKRGVNPPTTQAARLNEAVAQHQAGQLAAADSIYQDILRLEPRNPDALHLSGVIALQTERFEAAHDLIGRAIAINPSVPLYHRNMGITLEALELGDEALVHFTKAIELEPDNIENHLRLAHAMDNADRSANAAQSFRNAVKAGADDAETHTFLAVALTKNQEVYEAGRHFALALQRAPHAAFANSNMGRFHAEHDDPAAAEPLLRRALEIDPEFSEALIEFGALMNATFRPDEAFAPLERARILRPESKKARSEFARALQLSGQSERAVEEFNALLTVDPSDHRAHNNLGLILSRLDRFEDAIAAYDNSLVLNPEYDQARSNRSLLRLALGDFVGGWEDYLYRDSTGEMTGSFNRDVLPTNLSGKRIALYRDQGLGDEIFFLRFAAELKKRGARISYNPDQKIAGMIGRLDFIDDIVNDDWPADEFDLCCSLGDLPFLLSNADASGLPPPLELPVLAARDEEITTFLKTIGPPPYIGCTWRAGVQYRDKLSKMSPQAAMAETLLPLNGTILILQRNPRGDEIEEIKAILGDQLIDASHFNEDLEGMLALMGRIDEYVCVSNTNTHLRAARGLTSRVLIPLPADYRWMQSGDVSPWFPGTPLYRETADNGWDTAFENLRRDLSQPVGTR